MIAKGPSTTKESLRLCILHWKWFNYLFFVANLQVLPITQQITAILEVLYQKSLLFGSTYQLLHNFKYEFDLVLLLFLIIYANIL